MPWTDAPVQLRREATEVKSTLGECRANVLAGSAKTPVLPTRVGSGDGATSSHNCSLTSIGDQAINVRIGGTLPSIVATRVRCLEGCCFPGQDLLTSRCEGELHHQ